MTGAPQGIFSKAPGAPAIVPQLQLVFEESAEQLARAATPEVHEPLAVPSAPPPAPTANSTERLAANGSIVSPPETHNNIDVGAISSLVGAKARPGDVAPEASRQNGTHHSIMQQVEQPLRGRSAADEEVDEELDYEEEDDGFLEEMEMEPPPHGAGGVTAASSGAAGLGSDKQSPIGPAMGPAAGPASLSDPPGAVEEDNAQPVAAPSARTVGPAMPPPELLAAAQEAALAVSPPCGLLESFIIE